MSVKVYRLAVVYPEGSHDEQGVPVHGWEPSGWEPDLRRGLDEDLQELPFSWPRPRLYLSRSGVDKRAALLRSFGATVEIQPSKPIEWEEPA